MPFEIIAIKHDSYCDLPTPQHRWLLMTLARYANRDGRCWPSMRQLARDARMSVATVCRYLRSMADLGVFQRSRRPGGRYRYQLAEAYVPRWPGRVSQRQRPVPPRDRYQANQGKPHTYYADKHQVEQVIHDDSSRWEPRLRAWASSGGRFWPVFAGPPPTDPGCWAPRDLIQRAILSASAAASPA